MRGTNNSSTPPIFAWLLFLVWPFGMFLIAVRNFKSKSYRLFILLFFIFFGFTFVIKTSGADSYKHHLLFQEAAQKPNSELYTIISDFVTLSGDDLDVYAPLANFFVSRFTTETAYVFALHAFMFGFFYLKSIGFVFDEFNGAKNRKAFLFLFMFVSLFSIHQINAVRYFIAFWIWMYGALQLLSTKNPKFILVCVAASLAHFGITPATGVLIIFYLLGPRDKIYLPLVIISFIVGNFFQLDALVELGTKINDAAEKRAQTYTNLDVYATRLENFQQTAWFIQLRANALQYYLLFALSYIYIRRRDFKWDKKQEYLLSFLMLYLSFVNFVIQVPSFGGRMRYGFWTMSAYFLYRFFHLNKIKRTSIIVLAGLFPILLWAAVEFRISTQFTNIIAIIGNPLFVLIDKSNTSVFDIIFKK